MRMNLENSKKSMGITLRTALLSWLVTIATVLVFVIMIIPMQKRTFLENLESKARGLVELEAGDLVDDQTMSMKARRLI